MAATHAWIIADTTAFGARITTIAMIYPKFIEAQLVKHRTIVSSTRSSRAVPTATLLKEVEDTPFVPKYWGKNRRGMHATQTIEDTATAIDIWNEARADAIKWARALAAEGVHKQTINRLLEPFGWAYAVRTATDQYMIPNAVGFTVLDPTYGEGTFTEFNPWEHLFSLRCEHDAQPEIQELANKIRYAYRTSIPHSDTIHLPYVSFDERASYKKLDLLLISAMRCARVSYKPFDQKAADPEEDIRRAKELWQAGHLTPFEHCAEALYWQQCGSYFGWQSGRQLIAEEMGK